jgi:hypothetical protein
MFSLCANPETSYSDAPRGRPRNLNLVESLAVRKSPRRTRSPGVVATQVATPSSYQLMAPRQW